MTPKQLDALKVAIKAEEAKRVEASRKAAATAAAKAAAAHGFTLVELGLSLPAKSAVNANYKETKKQMTSEPKFADPANPARTWTGKGRRPDWFKSAVASGTRPDAMLIAKAPPQLSAVA